MHKSKRNEEKKNHLFSEDPATPLCKETKTKINSLANLNCKVYKRNLNRPEEYVT